MNPEKNEWASQKLDLLSYKINIRFWRSYIIRDLHRSAQKIPHSQFTSMVHIRHGEIRDGYYSYRDESELNNKEKHDQELAPMEKMIEDVLEADRAWQAAS